MLQLIAYVLFMIFIIWLYFKILFRGQDGYALEGAVYYVLINAFLNMSYLFNDGILEFCLIVVFSFIMNLLAFTITNKFNINNKLLYFIIFNIVLIVIAVLLLVVSAIFISI